MAAAAGIRVREERKRRRWSLSALAARAGISPAHVAEVEAGQTASLETYARLFTALDLEPEVTAIDPRRRVRPARPDEDLVHAAMGELEVARLVGFGFEAGIDEPYQHYQFAGRADVVAWDREARALLHIENRTQFPNVQEALGSFGAKRAYLGRALAARLGIDRGWRSECHVIAALWTSEVLHAVRLRATTFRVSCPDDLDAFQAWWTGAAPGRQSVTSSFLLLDPKPGVREAFRIGPMPGSSTRPRYRGYAEVAELLRQG